MTTSSPVRSAHYAITDASSPDSDAIADHVRDGGSCLERVDELRAEHD